MFFWHVWAFIAPGLYEGEKRFVVPFVASSSLLFAGGSFFGYSLVFPLVFDFFNSFSSDFVISAWTMKEVFSLTTRLFLAFGVAFELPLLVFFLAIAGIVTAKQLLSFTPYAVLGVFITAAILTPPDVLDYVAAHEVAHLAQMNHSPAFWAEVERIYGPYQEARGWLRTHGSDLPRFKFTTQA